MSETSISASPPTFHTIFCDALNRYCEKTKNDLLTHPLTADLNNCKDPNDILAVLDEKYDVRGFIHGQSQTSTQWLNATFTVLSSFSAAIGQGVGMVLSPGKVIFVGIGVLLITARDVGANNDALVGIFARIETFFKRLEIYTKVPPTDEMRAQIIQILAEVIEVIAVVTKWIKWKFSKKFLRKLVGRMDIEDATTKLDKLTQEEALMAHARSLELLLSVESKVDTVIDGESQARRGQLYKDLQNWLSPPDPSINFNAARKIYHEGTATWFTQGSTFEHWKSESSESMLWIHGKPGSGKSILSSTIIEGVKTAPNAGASHVIYLFFDFKDVAKQDSRALLSSLLVQLSTQSEPCFHILFDIYSRHGNGSRQPNEGILLQCLKSMLMASQQVPTYLVVDAVDECPNAPKAPGDPLSRQEVLEIVKDLVELRLPNLHICMTSRPEDDIQNAVQELASLKVSLHDEGGQKDGIATYVHFVVYSNKYPAMKRWGGEVKKQVVEALSSNADGMFRWVVCQLDALRECLARNVPQVLRELPDSLDETYERILRGINKSNRNDVYRLLQCLVVSLRPLRVEELAEVFALDFDSDEEIPKLIPDWREDQEQALQAACPSLISIVNSGDSRVVQFSHFSVKEYLTSPRLAKSCGDISWYHISIEPAHTTLAKACLGVLLGLDDSVSEGSNGKKTPLAEYAAKNWVAHAQFENVSLRIQKGMQDLFNPNKPHFAAWVQLHDIDTAPYSAHPTVLKAQEGGGTLYYAALCGFQDLAEHLIVKNSQDVNSFGGHCWMPLLAVLMQGYVQMAESLFQHGADVNGRCSYGLTLLHFASSHARVETVQWLLSHGADPNAKSIFRSTPLHMAASWERCVTVAQILLDHNADIEAQDSSGETPLSWAVLAGHFDAVCLLLARGAYVNVRHKDGTTPLHLASGKKQETDPRYSMRLRFVDIRHKDDPTPLQLASDEEDAWDIAPYQWMIGHPPLEVAHTLLEHGADVGAEDNEGRTSFHIASSKGHKDIAKLLSEYGAK